MRRQAGLILVFLLAAATARAEGFDIAAPPSWVAPQTWAVPDMIPRDQVNDGIYYLLLNRQVRVTRDGPVFYRHFVKQVLTEQGVERASQVYITFDPSYQILTLHQVRLLRGHTIINQLQPEKITVFQRETELDRLLYNGQKTASIVLEGTRPGDIIEYAYTIAGQNPVFKGKLMDDADLAAAVPLQRIFYRWLLPAGAPFYYKVHNGSGQDLVHHGGLNDEYIFSAGPIDAILPDDNLPAWYYPYPWVQISQFASWREVADLESGLFQAPAELSEALQQKIEALRTAAGPEQRVAQALCAVQKEIRYLGMEMGTGSHKPSDPSTVFQRQFGDCKDKVHLFCTILKRLGMDAVPALVDTRLRDKIADYLPSSAGFNHVIARVQAPDGQIYWLDPTSECQQVNLARQYQALYGKALVLGKGSTDLTDTGLWLPASPLEEVVEQFDLTPGVGKPAQLSVCTTFHGPRADAMRYKLAATGMPQMSKNYLNYYASDYPSIELDQPMQVQDDPKNNAVTISERYRIPEFWQRSDEGGWQATFQPGEIYDLVKKPDTLIRTMPLALRHPLYLTQKTVVLLPEPWPDNPSRFKVDNDALFFDYNVTYERKRLTLSYTFRTKTGTLQARQARSYFADLEAIYEELGYSLFSGGAAASSGALNWLVIGSGLLAVALGVALVRVILRWDPPPLPEDPLLAADSNLHGLGGFLIIVLVGIGASTAMIGANLAHYQPVLSLDYWTGLVDAVRPGMLAPARIFVLAELLLNILFLHLFGVKLFLFFKKRTSFPRIFIAARIAYLCFVAVDDQLGDLLYAQGAGIKGKGPSLFGMTLGTLIWSAYMLKSLRVKQTFTVRRVLLPKATQPMHELSI